MGCDIHITVQVREPEGWQSLTETEAGTEYEREGGPREQCYALFARLAGVRNREGVTPLFAGRGLPEDLTDGPIDRHPADYSLHVLDLDVGDHSLTHATVAELRAADWALDEPREYYGFLRWLDGPKISGLCERYGVGNVRCLIGFNS
jgi:hypothetical protein